MGQSVDLGVSAIGLKFENPFILASAPPTAGGDLIRKAFAKGWAGAVIKTIKPDELNVSDVSPRFETIRGDDGSIIGFENIELLSKKPVAYWVGNCLRACSDSGYQAISMTEKTIVIDEDRCDGCSLCSLVCPQQAISLAGHGQQNLEAVL